MMPPTQPKRQTKQEKQLSWLSIGWRCVVQEMGDLQDRVDAIRQYVATAAGGISIGASLMILVPAELMRIAGLQHANHMVAVKTAILAAAISLAARGVRI